MAAVGLILVLGLVFWRVKLDPGYLRPGRSLNLVLADVSVVLLCLTLMLGPLARLMPRLRRLVPWGRELGVAVFVTAGLHLLILLDGGWDVFAFVLTDSFRLGGAFASRLRGDIFGASNMVGLLALGFALVLAATSNDWSQRLLGRGWKFVQRQTYTLFVLVWLHAAVWIVLGDGAGWTWFWTSTALAVIAQFAGFVHTVRSSRGPSPQRAPAKVRQQDSSLVALRVAKWVGVTALWGVLIMASLLLSTAESPELVLFCEKYEEVKDSMAMEAMGEHLTNYMPDDVPWQAVFGWIEECQSR